MVPVAMCPPLQEGALNVQDLSSLRAELDIPIPDPAKEELKKKKQEEEEASGAHGPIG
ncbi:UNVERIFIED_CONTAM: hypothetical protein FKN15_045293 [Acipenser sinensis]